jgi:hypothetical protein
MQDIDFLPIEYRQKYSRRQSQPWQIVVAVMIVGLVAAAAIMQQYRRFSVRRDIAAITKAYETATLQQARLADAEKQAKSASAAAELYTYLKHPWPRTQLLSALVNPLPDTITLQQIQITREAQPGAQAVDKRTPTEKKADEERIKSLDSAGRDLAQLSERLDSLQTVVVLVGRTSDAAALHKYIGELDATDIFNKADLDSFSTLDSNQGSGMLQFRAVLTVQPGYGQPGGPVEPQSKQMAKSQGGVAANQHELPLGWLRFAPDQPSVGARR